MNFCDAFCKKVLAKKEKKERKKKKRRHLHYGNFGAKNICDELVYMCHWHFTKPIFYMWNQNETCTNFKKAV